MKIILMVILVLVSLQADVQHFKNTQDAFDTFVSALKNKDKKSLTNLLTPKYKEIVAVKNIDKDNLELFLKRYEESHRYVSFDGKSVYIEIGTKGWTLPIPLIKDANGWYFDINIGIDNMITREIGKNELAIISALRANKNVKELQMQKDLKAFMIFQDNERIVAQPNNYKSTAIMTFVSDKNGNIYEADLKEKKYIFDDRFKKIHKNNWSYK